MGVKDLFIWYQKKIGTYDKQKWETTIEQKILYGLRHVPMKSTTPNTDFIDLDLLRGSSFSKTKPKQGFMTVARLATLRCVLLPIYSKWWRQQTSPYIFLLMFSLYVSQLVNIAIYYDHIKDPDEGDKKENVMCMELIVPFLMTWIFSLVHSQIAAVMPESQGTKLATSRSYRVKIRPEIVNNKKKSEATNKNIEELRKNLRNRKCKKSQGEDDGFESLNGNGSRTSEEEILGPTYKNIIFTRKRCDEWIKKQSIVNRKEVLEQSSDSEPETVESQRYRAPTIKVIESACDTDDEFGYKRWMNATNSEDYSYSSDLEEVSDGHSNRENEDFAAASSIFNTPSIKVSCIVWKRNEIKKAELSMLDISSAIIGKVEATSHSMDYFYVGLLISTLHALIPVLFRLFTLESSSLADVTLFEWCSTLLEKLPTSSPTLLEAAFGSSFRERAIIITASVQRWFLASLFFFLLAVAENTFKQRFLYAKLFSHLTSFRRAQHSELPHFRLNKVRNIKTWLSVRSHLKQRGPQRSVDVIVSTAFIITLLLLSFLCVELLKETGALNSQYHVEALVWCLGVGILLLRFMTLGNKINKKYRNLSVLITEQINLHLQIEQKPQKKEELALANNVLKLAIDLIKELQSPFKISGLSANSVLYNTTKLLILSALSGILSEVLGFKLKLHKLKIK